MVTDNGSYLDYFQLAGVLQKAAFVIGNDTGPTHMGAHLMLRGLGLFGGHNTTESTGIQHSNFSWIEVEDLKNLTLEMVWEKFISNSNCESRQEM